MAVFWGAVGMMMVVVVVVVGSEDGLQQSAQPIGKQEQQQQEEEQQQQKLQQQQQYRRPNVVVLVADDLGIGDLGCYGNTTINTPNIDRLARQGVRLTHHLTAATVCTPSRAALLTSRYPARYGLVGGKGTSGVIGFVAVKVGLPLDEVTLATALTAANYTTAAVGKWHLGSRCGLFGRGCRGPHLHGFQSFFGVPATLMQEMGSPHPFFTLPPDNTVYQMLVTIMLVTGVTLWGCKRQRGAVFVLLPFALFLIWFTFSHYRFHTDRWWLASPWMMRIMNSILMDDERVLEQPMVLAGLSQRLVDHSVKFIAHHAQDDRPFFLYHSFTHVHIPMFTAANMSGRSKHGRYGDNVEEMDDGVGRILNALTEHGLDQHTLIYFTSDHGGHLEARENGERVGGYNGRFKGGKCAGGTEGGIRVPGIYRWSGHIPAGVTDDTPISMLDLLPTTLHLTGLPPLSQLMPHLPQRELDGVSIGDLLTSRKQLPPRVLLHHCKGEIHALRIVQGNATYKMQLAGYKFKPGSTQCGWGLKTCCSCYDVINYSHEPQLFNLQQDPYEDHPIPTNTTEYMQVTGILKQYLAKWRERVTYPPSLFGDFQSNIHLIWRQPFRSLW